MSTRYLSIELTKGLTNSGTYAQRKCNCDNARLTTHAVTESLPSKVLSWTRNPPLENVSPINRVYWQKRNRPEQIL